VKKYVETSHCIQLQTAFLHELQKMTSHNTDHKFTLNRNLG